MFGSRHGQLNEICLAGRGRGRVIIFIIGPDPLQAPTFTGSHVHNMHCIALYMSKADVGGRKQSRQACGIRVPMIYGCQLTVKSK